MCVCVCVCVRERERESSTKVIIYTLVMPYPSCVSSDHLLVWDIVADIIIQALRVINTMDCQTFHT